MAHWDHACDCCGRSIAWTMDIEQLLQLLGATAQVYVTMAAAQTYAAARGLAIEAARRELTEYLLEARRPEGSVQEDGPELWRFRRRSTGVDISARISREGRLAVVVAVSVRRY